MLTRNKKAVSMIGIFLMVAILAITVSTNTFASLDQEKAAITYEGKAPKYIFLFIGDGLSYPQITSTEMYLGKKAGLKDIVDGGGIEKLNFSNFPTAGSAQTYDSSSFIPDSASTATSLASGYKTLSGVINMDQGKAVSYTPITERLAAKGYKVGIVSSVPLNHATPAAFYAKVPSRGMYYEIASQIPGSGFDYFGGGGFLSPTGSNSDQPHIYEVLKKKGYTIVNTREDILKLSQQDKKVVAVSPDMSVDGTSLPYEIDRQPGQLSLADFVKKGIDVLENPNGFFMMVEGGKIDWAGHANDAPAVIHDTIAFADAVEAAIDFYHKHPDETLIVVTGDHETGGMTIGFAGTGYSTFFDKIQRATTSSDEAFRHHVLNPYKENHTIDTAQVSDLAGEIKAGFGLLFPDDKDAEKYPEMVLTPSEIQKLEDALKQSMTPAKERANTEEEQLLYGGYEPFCITITHILNHKAGISFTSYAHTGLPAPVFAIGKGHELFNGFYDNTDIYHKMAAILNVK